MSTYKRPIFHRLFDRMKEPRRFLQVLSGPRQVGKTTLVRQVAEGLAAPMHYASADDPLLKDVTWIRQQWEIGRLRARDGAAMLILDEVQKVPSWSVEIKRLWDEDSAAALPLKVVVLGSAPLLVSRGLSDSLAGRFEILPVTHWTLTEMQEAFGFDLERYVYFGGYPGAAPLTSDPERWARYIIDSLIETTVSRDILLLSRVDKPALLRQLFQLGCAYSGQVLSYQKMVGQLQDAGNTTTLSHYLELLAGAGLLCGLPKFAGQRLQQRGSSPKLQVLNTALLSAPSALSLPDTRSDPDRWGRLVENAVGAHLANGVIGTSIELFYWREGQKEVDFVLRAGSRVTAIEVKSSLRKGNVPGLSAFGRAFGEARQLLVGGAGISIEEFLRTPVAHWVA